MLKYLCTEEPTLITLLTVANKVAQRQHQPGDKYPVLFLIIMYVVKITARRYETEHTTFSNPHRQTNKHCGI